MSKTTNLSALSDVVTVKDGNIGVGISSPFSPTHISNVSVSPTASGNMADNGLTISNGVGGRAVQIGVDEANARNYIQSGYVNNSNVANDLVILSGANETVRVDSAGRVTMPHQPHVHAYLSATWTIPTTGSYQDIPFDAAITNTGNHFANSRFTAPVNGVYYISYHVRLDGHSGSYIRANIKINGGISHHNGFFLTQDTGSYTSLNGSQAIYLAAGDFVTISARTQSDTTVNVSASTSFSTYLLG